MITGGTFLQDGRLVLITSAEYRLLVFDTQYKYKRHHEIDVFPLRVCSKETSTVVVICNELIGRITRNYKSYLISYSLIGDTCEKKKEFLIDDFVLSIDVAGDAFIVVYFDQIHKYNENGEMITRIMVGAPILSQILTEGHRVCVSPDRSMFYHSDLGLGNININIVCRMVESGDEVSRYPSSGLPNSLDCMCYDKECLLYCKLDGRGMWSIHRLTSDLKADRVILKRLEGIRTPSSIIYNPSKDEFVVTSSYSYDDVLFNVYKP